MKIVTASIHIHRTLSHGKQTAIRQQDFLSNNHNANGMYIRLRKQTYKHKNTPQIPLFHSLEIFGKIAESLSCAHSFVSTPSEPIPYQRRAKGRNWMGKAFACSTPGVHGSQKQLRCKVESFRRIHPNNSKENQAKTGPWAM